MKKFVILCSAAVMLGACNQPLLEEDVLEHDVQSVIIDNPLLPPPIIFNPFTGNPYAVSTMREAFVELKTAGELPADADVDDYVYTSHIYVKFSPESDEQVDALMADSTMILYNYPIDNEMTAENDEYTIRPEEGDTTTLHLYTAVPSDKVLPTGIPYTILEELYIPDECSGNSASPSMKTISGEDISENIINALVDKSYQLAGDIIFVDPIGPQNGGPDAEQMSNQYTELWRPAGNISAYDDIVDGPVPLQGIKVRARRWFTTHTGVTDANGDFVCDGRFKRPAVYSFKWEGDRWDIRDGAILQAYYRGPKIIGNWNLYITGGRSLSYSAIHRAAYRWYHGNIQGLTRPVHNRKEKISYFHKSHHNNWGDYWAQVGMGILYDIRVWGKSRSTNTIRPVSGIFSTTCHEIGHAAHFTNSLIAFPLSSTFIRESWARCIEYVMAKQEYTEKEALDKLYITDTIRMRQVIDNHMYEFETYWITPDMKYNYQAWYTDRQPNYTPLFIDLIDNFNQNEYYQAKLNEPPSVDGTNAYNPNLPPQPSAYPIDRINNMPPSLVENIVFNNTSIAGIKADLVQYAQDNPTEAAEYNLTEQNINQLFYYYGY
ncbi:MAG: hypothetical protein E7130_01580 [Rikenellaceae bacterium]|nr:hypothetical protein [Rikenellaceae bacterium]